MQTIILIIILLSLTHSKKLTLQCSVDCSGCFSDQCYNIIGDGLTKQEICFKQNAPSCLMDPIQFNVFPCSTDFQGQTCSSQTCAGLIFAELCTSQFSGSSCPVQTSQVRCQNCRYSSGCTQCLSLDGVQVCKPQNMDTCNWKTELSVGNCSGGIDTLGTKCDCCSKVGFEGQIGYCLKDTPLSIGNMRKIIQWASDSPPDQTRPENQTQIPNFDNFQNSLKVVLAFILLIVIY